MFTINSPEGPHDDDNDYHDDTNTTVNSYANTMTNNTNNTNNAITITNSANSDSINNSDKVFTNKYNNTKSYNNNYIVNSAYSGSNGKQSGNSNYTNNSNSNNNNEELVGFERPKDHHYKDILFLFAFAWNLLIVIAIALYYGVLALRNSGADYLIIQQDGTEIVDESHVWSPGKILTGISAMIVFSSVLSIGWIYLLSRLSSYIILATLVTIVAINISCAVLMFIWNQFTLGLLLVLLTVGIIYFFFRIRSRIHLAASNLRIGCEAIIQMPATIPYAMIVLVIQIVFIVIWSIAAIGFVTNESHLTKKFSGIIYHMDECATLRYSDVLTLGETTVTCPIGSWCNICECEGLIVSSSPCFKPKFYGFYWFLMLLSLFWTSSVLSNIVHCTTSGGVARWWCSKDTSTLARLTFISESFNRAITTSLGSICFGSLLIAVVRATRVIVSYSVKQTKKISSPTVQKLVSCIVYMLEYTLVALDRLLLYFNRYAFCYVAIYGFDFVKASKSAVEMFAAKGLTTIIHDDVIDLVLNMGHIGIGLLTMCVGFAYTHIVTVEKVSATLIVLMGFFCGYCMSMITVATISSAVATIYVCFGDQPDIFKVTHPEEYVILQDAWSRVLITKGSRKHSKASDVEANQNSQERPGGYGLSGVWGAGGYRWGSSMANAADDSFDDDNNDNLSNSQLSGDSSNRTVRGTFTRNSPQQGSFSFFSSNFGKRNSNYNSENARYHTVGTVEHEDVEGVEPSTEDSTLGSHASSMFRSILGYVSNSFVVGRNDPSIANRQPVHSSLNGSSAYGRNPNNKYNSDIDRSLLESITL